MSKTTSLEWTLPDSVLTQQQDGYELVHLHFQTMLEDSRIPSKERDGELRFSIRGEKVTLHVFDWGFNSCRDVSFSPEAWGQYVAEVKKINKEVKKRRKGKS